MAVRVSALHCGYVRSICRGFAGTSHSLVKGEGRSRFPPISTGRIAQTRLPSWRISPSLSPCDLRIRFSSSTSTEPPSTTTIAEDPDSPPEWTIKMLYDGACPLCLREVDMLRERNKTYRKIKLVDFTSDSYSAEENAGVDFETAMGRIHAILRDGTVLTNVAAFKRLYEEVGLGWVYAITNYEPFATIVDTVYDFWAKYRLPITGRPPLVEVLRARKQRQSADMCDVNGCGQGESEPNH